MTHPINKYRAIAAKWDEILIFDEKQKRSQDFSGKTVDSVVETVRSETQTDGTNGE